MNNEYTRDNLIKICEDAIVAENEWMNRDTPESQASVGKCWAYLKAGCEYKVIIDTTSKDKSCVTDEKTIWLNIIHESFSSMEGYSDEKEEELFYLPTRNRLDEKNGKDWY